MIGRAEAQPFRLRMLRWLLLASGLAYAFIASSFLITSYQQSMRNAEHAVQNEMTLHRENAALALSAMETALLAVGDTYWRSDETDPVVLQRFLDQSALRLQPLRVISIINPQGIIVADSYAGDDAVGLHVRDRNYFYIHQLWRYDGIYFGLPIRSRVDGDWLLPMSLALYNDDGSQAGVVAAFIDLSYFSDIHTRGNQTIGYMARQTGQILTAFPAREAAIGYSLHDDPSFDNLHSYSDGDFYWDAFPLANSDYYISHDHLEDYRLVLAFAQRRDVVLGSYYRNVALAAGMGVGLFLFALGTWHYEAARIRALLAHQAALEHSNRRLNLLATIDRAILRADSPEATMQNVVRPLLAMLGCDRLIFTRFDFVAGTGVSLGASQTDTIRQTVPLQRVLQVAEQLRRGQWHIVPNMDTLDSLSVSEQLWYDDGIRAYTMVPLLAQGELMGTLSLGLTIPGLLSDEQQAIVQEVANQMAIALRQADYRAALEREKTALESRVAERTRDLERINDELEAFTYSVSHDLRAPLRSLDGFSQALLEDYPEELDASAQDYLKRIRAASMRMGHLIDDLLDLSRISRQAFMRQPGDLSALARELAQNWQERSSPRMIQFIIEENLTVDCDMGLVRIALNNLFENAVKFTAPRTPAIIRFYACAPGVFVVSDNGVGFEMAYADKLFGAFQRLHSNAEFPGTGIGLATVQRIIHRHGGGIRAESAPGEGAKFYFTLADSTIPTDCAPS